MGKWKELAGTLKLRDKHQVEDINGLYGGGMTIENRIALADARAVDALGALFQVLEYIDDLDTSNAEVSGLSTRPPC
jgi:hypothetical protein